MLYEKINILIIGNGFKVEALAKKFRTNPNVEKIYITNYNSFESNFCNYIDIRENDITGLLKFAIENNVNLTIPVSEVAIKNDIVSFFEANGQNIFGPVKHACSILFNKAIQKKLLYRIKAPIPKFAIFNKMQPVREYLKTSVFPVRIFGNENESQNYICTTESKALNCAEKLINSGETDIIIQDYIFGLPTTTYFITDGYSILPINSALNYIFKSDDNAVISKDIGSYSPDYRITNSINENLLQIGQNIISSINSRGNSYMGILGIEFIFTNNNFYVTNLTNFMKDSDAHAILNSVEDDLLKMFYSCINGFFADEYSKICTNNLYSVSVIAQSSYDNNKEEKPYEDDDFDISPNTKNSRHIFNKNSSFMITKSASTLSHARKLVYNELSEISTKFEYKKDIGLNSSRI